MNANPEAVRVDARTPVAMAVAAYIGPIHEDIAASFSVRVIEKFEIDQFELNHLPANDREKLRQFLVENIDIFNSKDKPLGKATSVKHTIFTGDSRPVVKAPYRVPFSRRKVKKELVDVMLDAGVITPSTSPYSAPI